MGSKAWSVALAREALAEARKRLEEDKHFTRFYKYHDNPTDFCKDVLNVSLTKDMLKIFEAIVDNPVVLVKSANAIGKTFSAAHIAVWYYKCRNDSQVYATAAPPIDNLKRILWGEIMSIVQKNPELFKLDKITRFNISRSSLSFITGVAIPTSGTAEQREAKFCALADDTFELLDGTKKRYKDLVGEFVIVKSISKYFKKVLSQANFFDNGLDYIYEITLVNGIKLYRTPEHPFYVKNGNFGMKDGVWKNAQFLTDEDYLLFDKNNNFVWMKVKDVKLIGKFDTVGVEVPVYHNYITDVLEHNSGKHAPNLLFIVDEGDAVPPEIYRGIESCMSGGDSRLLVLFNPRVPSGRLYQMEMERSAKIINTNAFNHPNVISGKELIKGAVTREITVRRINEWTRSLNDGEQIDGECFEIPSYLVGSTALSNEGIYYEPLKKEHRKIISNEFYYMVLGVYPSQSDSQLISSEWINKARDNWDEYVAQHGEVVNSPVIGLDIAEYGKDYNVACLRDGNFVSRFVLWSGLDVIKTADKVVSLYRSKKARLIVVDGTGVGSGVAPYISRLDNGNEKIRVVSIRVSEKPNIAFIRTDIGEFYQLRDQLWWAVREWLKSGEAMLPPDEYLIDELKTPTYKIFNGKIKIMDKDSMRKVLKRSPDRADSLCLTFAPQRRAKIISLDY